MRLDHLLSKEEVKGKHANAHCLVMRIRWGSDVARAPREQSSLGRGRAAYTSENQNAYVSKLPGELIFGCALTTEFAKLPVAMRLGVTPVPIPNTMVKT